MPTDSTKRIVAFAICLVASITVTAYAIPDHPPLGWTTTAASGCLIAGHRISTTTRGFQRKSRQRRSGAGIKGESEGPGTREAGHVARSDGWIWRRCEAHNDGQGVGYSVAERRRQIAESDAGRSGACDAGEAGGTEVNRLERRRAKNERHRANTKRKWMGWHDGGLWKDLIEALFAKRRKRKR